MQAQENQRCADRVLLIGKGYTQYIFDTGSDVILRRCHLGDRGCVSNFAHAPARRRGGGLGGRSQLGSGQASERKPDEEEECREVGTQAINAENRGNAGLSEYPNIYVAKSKQLLVYIRYILRRYKMLACTP